MASSRIDRLHRCPAVGAARVRPAGRTVEMVAASAGRMIVRPASRRAALALPTHECGSHWSDGRAVGCLQQNPAFARLPAAR